MSKKKNLMNQEETFRMILHKRDLEGRYKSHWQCKTNSMKFYKQNLNKLLFYLIICIQLTRNDGLFCLEKLLRITTYSLYLE